MKMENSRDSMKNIWKYNGQKEIQWSKIEPSCSHGAYSLIGKVDIKYIITYINMQLQL